MQLRFIIFVSFMTLTTAMATRWVGKRLVSDSTFPPFVKTTLWILLILMVSSVVIVQSLNRLIDNHSNSVLMSALNWFAFTSLGLIPTLIIFTFLRELSLLPLNEERRALTKNFFNIGALGLSSLFAAIGMVQARQLPRVKRVSVPIEGLDPKLEGLKIAQLTDVHVGHTIRGDHISAIVDLTNSLKPDIIALTGDLVDGLVSDLEPHVAVLKKLSAPYGKYYVTGNHEYYWGAAAWSQHLEKNLGFKYLANEHVSVPVNGKKVLIAGVTDLQGEHFSPLDKCDPAKAIAHAPKDVQFKLLLAHQPKVCELTDGKSFDLQLSGHTHAGQFWPITMFIGLFHKYIKGLYRYGSGWVYVSPATCYWGPPNRLFNPSEITLIELKRA